jgi:hypothetical protein
MGICRIAARTLQAAMLWLAVSLPAGAAVDADESPDPESDDSAPERHWSGLPIWGVEAEARGYAIPDPFGIGMTVFSAEQPVNIRDLQLGFRGNPPVSVTNFLQIDRVDTTQQNASVKFDVLVLPFLDVYAIGGYTKGTTKGTIQVPATPPLGILEPRQLQLDAAFEGPTVGAGFTLQGGTMLNEDWHELTAIVVLDWNRTRTDLEFSNEALIADTRPEATVVSARLGLHAIGDTLAGAVWIGGMHQEIQQTVAGRVSGTDIQFVVMQSPQKPWNTLLGGLLEIGADGSYVLVEGGFGARKSILVAGVYRF